MDPAATGSGGRERTWSWSFSWKWTWKPVRARETWAKGLFVLGCAAAALAFFAAMALPPPAPFSSSGHLHLGGCAPTDAEAAELRAASMELLLAAAAQMLAATVALRVQVTPVNIVAWVLGGQTGVRAVAILGALASCNGHLHGAVAFYYGFTHAMIWVLFIVGVPVSFRRDDEY